MPAKRLGVGVKLDEPRAMITNDRLWSDYLAVFCNVLETKVT